MNYINLGENEKILNWILIHSNFWTKDDLSPPYPNNKGLLIILFSRV